MSNTTPLIHPSAIIDPSAKLADDVCVGPYSLIGANVTLGAGCKLESHVVIKGESQIGKNNHFYQFCSIGEDCQDKKYANEPTRLEVGDNNIFRECVTVHRGTIQDQSLTKIGSNNLLMAYAHIAHDCVLGDHIVVANSVNVAGHVHVGDHVILGGSSAVHQFCHIGAHAFVAGGAIVLRDIPHFVMVGGIDHTPKGINAEGLRRRGFSSEDISQIRRAYKVIYRNGLRAEEAVTSLQEMAKNTPVLADLADFISQSSRGIVR